MGGENSKEKPQDAPDDSQQQEKPEIDTSGKSKEEIEKEKIRLKRLQMLSKSNASPQKDKESELDEVAKQKENQRIVEEAKRLEEEKQKQEEERRKKEEADKILAEKKQKAEQEALKLKQEEELKAKNDVESPQKSSEPSPIKSESSDKKSKPQSKLAKETNIHKLMSDGFEVSLSKGMKNKLYMGELSMEKSMNNQQQLFTMEDIPTIIHFLVHAKKNENKFRYLYQAYRRVKGHLLSKTLAVDEILDYIASYFSILFTSPESLEVPTSEVESNMTISGSAPNIPNMPPGMDQNPQMAMMLQMMMQSQSAGQTITQTFTNIENEFYTACVEESIITIDPEFVSKIVTECGEDMFELIIRKAYFQLDNIKEVNLCHKAASIASTFAALTNYEGFSEIFVDSPYFMPPPETLNGKKLQLETIFGRMLSINVWPTDNQGHSFFQGIAKQRPGAHKKIIENISDTLYSMYDQLQNLVKKLLKNKDVKDKVMLWFRSLVNCNTEYFKMMPNPMSPLTSKGCLFNSLALLLELCDPFTSKPKKFYDMFAKIDPHYCASNDYLKFKEIDKIAQDGIEEYKAEEPENFHFITECFFITHALIKLSFKKVIKEYNDAGQQANGAIQAKDFGMMDVTLSKLFSMQAHMFSNKFRTKLFQFLTFSSVYFCYENTIDNENYKDMDPIEFFENLDFEQGNEIKPACTHIPEHFSENISKIGMLYRVFLPHTFESPLSLVCLLGYCLFIIKTKKVHNPHIRAETLKFICEFAPKAPEYEFKKEEMNLRGALTQTTVCKKYLFSSLIEAYGDVEKTGSSNQYYEKYHYRLLLSFVFHFLLKEKHYQTQLTSICEDQELVFDKFTHFLIADINEGFQSSMTKLAEIKEYEEIKETTYGTLSEEQKKDLDEKFKENSNTVKWGMQLSRSTLSLCAKITQSEVCRMAFMSEVNLGSFVEGINYTLDSMVSDKGKKIKVKNLKDYHFDVKEITEELVQCYAFFGQYDKFVDQVVVDTRSYKEKNFIRVIKLIGKFKISIPANIAKEFEDFVSKCQVAHEENALKSTFLDDAPDEYIDQLFCVLMEDPVMLPSQNIVDRNQLKKHLMNDPTDPYTRAPLKLEDVEELPDLKTKIKEFKEQKLEEFRIAKEERQKALKEEAEGEMDQFE